MNSTYTDAATEYRTLREGSGLIEYEGAGVLRVSGTGAPAFLGTSTTRVVDFLLEGQITSALVLDEAGAILGEVLIHCEGTDYVLELWPSQADRVRERLEQAAAGQDNVTVEDVSASVRVLGLEGPNSFKLAEKYLSFPIASMAFNSFSREEWEGAPLLLARTGVTGEYGYKFHVDADKADALAAELIAHGAERCGREAIDVCRMEMRFANLEAEGPHEGFTPFDVGLQWMVDFGHDFTGRDALLKQWEDGLERVPVCWTSDSDLEPSSVAGTAVLLDGQQIGEVTHAVHSPQLGCLIGTASVDWALAVSGLTLQLGDDGTDLRTISAPFVVAASFGVALD